MIVPEFWAEARRRVRTRNRQVTVRRWGWSDASPADAEAMAAARADEALARALAEPKTLRREPRVAYNGAEGVPIREEIVSRHGSAVVTRNSYGARCLNTPDVLFADVDFRLEPDFALLLKSFLVVAAAELAATALFAPPGYRGLMAFGCVAAGLALAWPLARLVIRVWHGGRAGIKRAAIDRVQSFVDAHRQWSVRVYETPAGLRLLATHAPLNPRSAEVVEFFRRLRVDPVYSKMCVRQNCFRARLTAKPWRCGVTEHIKPRRAAWPVDAERIPARTAWIEAYERRAAGFAACTFLESVGSGMVHPKCAEVVKLHDDACRALVAGAPLA